MVSISFVLFEMSFSSYSRDVYPSVDLLPPSVCAIAPDALLHFPMRVRSLVYGPFAAPRLWRKVARHPTFLPCFSIAWSKRFVHGVKEQDDRENPEEMVREQEKLRNLEPVTQEHHPRDTDERRHP